MRWFLLALLALVTWVLVRWILKLTSGMNEARDRAIAGLRAVVPGAQEVRREAGLFVLLAADDRMELDATPVLKAALAHPSGGSGLEAALRPLVEHACCGQTDPGQIEDERAEARSVLGADAERMTDGQLLSALFGLADDAERDAALIAARDSVPSSASPERTTSSDTGAIDGGR